MPSSDDTEVRVKLRNWIREVSGEDVADDARIFEIGLLSSMEGVDLILFIESVRGDVIDLDIVDPNVFASIDTIVEGFFAGANHGSI